MPLNIVTLRLQTEREEKEEGEKPAILTRSGIIGTIKLVYKEQGLGGFWRGESVVSSRTAQIRTLTRL